TISIGVAMIIVALNGLIGFKFNIGPGIGWQLGFGIVSGVLGGVSSIWSPPVAMYLIARGIDKERFISATGFLFLVGALPLALGLYFGGILTPQILLQSGFGLVIVLFGFRIGEILRGRVTQAWFEKAVLIAFFFMGVRLVAVGVF
ncbi:MAG: TSUP family transporter, partial [Paracoccaceae bacterium]